MRSNKRHAQTLSVVMPVGSALPFQRNDVPCRAQPQAHSSKEKYGSRENDIIRGVHANQHRDPARLV
jgi:hypothetical protein